MNLDQPICKGTLQDLLTEMGEAEQEVVDRLSNSTLFKGIYTPPTEGHQKLLPEFFRMSGLRPTDQITVYNDPEMSDPVKARELVDGWAIYFFWEDFCVAVYRDKKPVSAMYESTRGDLYQSEAYFNDGPRGYYASNLGTIGGRSGNNDTWEEVPAEGCGIARSWLLGGGLF